MSESVKSAAESHGRAAALPAQGGAPSRDLRGAAQVDVMVDRFYERVLQDTVLAPLFLEVAGIDLAEHLPRIKAYWRKLLLGEPGYARHTMAIHRHLHRRRPLEPWLFDRWLSLFESSLDTHFSGPGAERARHLARRIASNMACGVRAGADDPVTLRQGERRAR